MQEWQHEYQNIFSLPQVGQHAGINSAKENIFTLGQHARMVGQHE
jgi:hypothetical protein